MLYVMGTLRLMFPAISEVFPSEVSISSSERRDVNISARFVNSLHIAAHSGTVQSLQGYVLCVNGFLDYIYI